MSKRRSYRPLAIKELKQFQRFLQQRKHPFYPVACKGEFEYARFESQDGKSDEFITPIVLYFRGSDNLGDKNQVLTMCPYHKICIEQFEEWKRKED